MEGDSREEGIGSPSVGAALEAVAELDDRPEPPDGGGLAPSVTGAYRGQSSSRQRSFDTPRAYVPGCARIASRATRPRWR